MLTYMKFIDSVYENLTKDNLVGTFVSLFLVIYGGMAAPTMPKNIKKLFEYPTFRLLILTLVAFSSTKDFRLSLLLAFSFVLSVSMFDNRYLNECFDSLEQRENFTNQSLNKCPQESTLLLCPKFGSCSVPDGCYVIDNELTNLECKNKDTYYLKCHEDDPGCVIENGCYEYPMPEEFTQITGLNSSMTTQLSPIPPPIEKKVKVEPIVPQTVQPEKKEPEPEPISDNTTDFEQLK